MSSMSSPSRHSHFQIFPSSFLPSMFSSQIINNSIVFLTSYPESSPFFSLLCRLALTFSTFRLHGIIKKGIAKSLDCVLLSINIPDKKESWFTATSSWNRSPKLTNVKQHRAWLLSRWVDAWEYDIL